MRDIEIVIGEHYHVMNRGNYKQLIFNDDRDRARFILLLLFYQGTAELGHINRLLKYLYRNKELKLSDTLEESVRRTLNTRIVELEAFVLMPNHFHLIVYERTESGIARYMQRVLNAYAKYFNTKYEKTGHLFQGPYKAVHVEDNDQLLYLSTYLHRNPRELRGWKDREHQYVWSSLIDYCSMNRWGKLLNIDLIMEQFVDGEEYLSYVKNSIAKE